VTPGQVGGSTTSRPAPTVSTAGGACGPFGSLPVSSLLVSTDPDHFTLSGALLQRCPDVQLPVTRAVYVGNGASSSSLTLYYSTTHTLSAAVRGTTIPPAPTPPGSCNTSLIVTVVGSGLPRTVTNIVPQLSSSGTDDPARLYFGNRGFDLIETSWSQPTC
jgi:hypothetical protein